MFLGASFFKNNFFSYLFRVIRVWDAQSKISCFEFSVLFCSLAVPLIMFICCLTWLRMLLLSNKCHLMRMEAPSSTGGVPTHSRASRALSRLVSAPVNKADFETHQVSKTKMDRVCKSFWHQLGAKGFNSSTIDAACWRYGYIGEFQQLLSVK